MHRRNLLLVVALEMSATVAWAAAGPWVQHPQVRARLIGVWNPAAGDEGLLLGAQFRLADGWHAYWKNPGDAGYPPRFTWSSRPALQDVRVLWPAPRRFLLPGDLEALGYADEVIYPVRARIQDPVDHPIEIASEIDYLVCADACIPYRDKLTLEIPTDGIEARHETDLRRLRQWERSVPSRTAAGGRPPASIRIQGERMIVRFDDLDAGAEAPALFFAVQPLFDLGVPTPLPGESLVYAVPIRRTDKTHGLPPTARFDWTLVTPPNAAQQSLEGSVEVRLKAGDGEATR